MTNNEVNILFLYLFFPCKPFLVLVSASYKTQPSLSELEGTRLCFISLLIFLRDWYLHTRIHTVLLCSADGSEERGLYFPLS